MVRRAGLWGAGLGRPRWAQGCGRRGTAGGWGALGGRDPGPGLLPCCRRFAAGLETAGSAAGPLRAPFARGGVQGGAARGLRAGLVLLPASRIRTGWAQPPAPALPGASQGNVLFLFVALGEVAGRKLKELSPHSSSLGPAVTNSRATRTFGKTTVRISQKQNQNGPQAPFQQISPDSPHPSSSHTASPT